MGLSRRQFTREFELAALQRLERRASVAEVARAFEVSPKCCSAATVRGGPKSKKPFKVSYRACGSSTAGFPETTGQAEASS
jgi:transposase-like protein